LTILLAPFFGFSIPMLPIHLLWINLVTDGFPGLALVAEPAEKNIMQKPPRPPKENLFANGLGVNILFTGLLISAAALFVQWWAVRQGCDLRTQQTMVFTTMCFIQLCNVLSVRSSHFFGISRGLFVNKLMWITILVTVALQLLIVYVPALQLIFKTAFLTSDSMTTIGAVLLVAVFATEMFKYIYYKKKPTRV
jgi:Ca2+-transporting ATPase